jgi:hypothetical protein
LHIYGAPNARRAARVRLVRGSQLAIARPNTPSAATRWGRCRSSRRNRGTRGD